MLSSSSPPPFSLPLSILSFQGAGGMSFQFCPLRNCVALPPSYSFPHISVRQSFDIAIIEAVDKKCGNFPNIFLVVIFAFGKYYGNDKIKAILSRQEKEKDTGEISVRISYRIRSVMLCPLRKLQQLCHSFRSREIKTIFHSKGSAPRPTQ